VGNKITCDKDKQFIADGLDMEVSAFLPFSEGIRGADRDGVSALAGMTDGERAVIEGIIEKIGKVKGS
jgi:hypothetical protein